MGTFVACSAEHDLEKKTWSEFLQGSVFFEFDKNEGVAVPLDYLETVEFQGKSLVIIYEYI